MLLLRLIGLAMGLVNVVVGGRSRLAEAHRFGGTFEGEKRVWQSGVNMVV